MSELLLQKQLNNIDVLLQFQTGVLQSALKSRNIKISKFFAKTTRRVLNQSFYFAHLFWGLSLVVWEIDACKFCLVENEFQNEMEKRSKQNFKVWPKSISSEEKMMQIFIFGIAFLSRNLPGQNAD